MLSQTIRRVRHALRTTGMAAKFHISALYVSAISIVLVVKTHLLTSSPQIRPQSLNTKYANAERACHLAIEDILPSTTKSAYLLLGFCSLHVRYRKIGANQLLILRGRRDPAGLLRRIKSQAPAAAPHPVYSICCQQRITIAMSQQAEITKTTYSGIRITVTSPHPFDTILSNLYASIGDHSKWPSEISLSDKASFTESVKSATGPHEFMNVYELPHGAWIGLFGVGNGLKVRRVVLGNPLIAITILQHDLEAGLFVPVELLVLENQDRMSAKVIYDLPSALIGAVNEDEALMKAARMLDEKLAVLVSDITK